MIKESQSLEMNLLKSVKDAASIIASNEHPPQH
jgi:hypothetical protein